MGASETCGSSSLDLALPPSPPADHIPGAVRSCLSPAFKPTRFPIRAPRVPRPARCLPRYVSASGGGGGGGGTLQPHLVVVRHLRLQPSDDRHTSALLCVDCERVCCALFSLHANHSVIFSTHFRSQHLSLCLSANSSSRIKGILSCTWVGHSRIEFRVPIQLSEGSTRVTGP